jgi:6-pyruvoyltetrahydropterin/6-carboxytetrahydropterin synthase
MIVTVWKKTTFDAAHHLPNYDGPCANVHGHTYILEVGLTGHIRENGMVYDMKRLGEWMDKLVERFDHHDLNESFGNPTAENIAKAIYADALYVFYPEMNVTIRLWETPTSWVECRS